MRGAGWPALAHDLALEGIDEQVEQTVTNLPAPISSMMTSLAFASSS